MPEHNLRARLEFLETQLQGVYSEEVEADYLVTKIEFQLWERREASRLGQIAKKCWMTVGDQNTNFFHSIINHKWKKGKISLMVLDNGRIIEGAELVHKEADAFFQNFLSDTSDVEECDLSDLIQDQIF